LLCFGAHRGPLNGFLEKPKSEKPKPKTSEDKPRVCGECDYLKGRYCSLNASYAITAETEACDRALPIEDKKKRKFFW